MGTVALQYGIRTLLEKYLPAAKMITITTKTTPPTAPTTIGRREDSPSCSGSGQRRVNSGPSGQVQTKVSPSRREQLPTTQGLREQAVREQPGRGGEPPSKETEA